MARRRRALPASTNAVRTVVYDSGASGVFAVVTIVLPPHDPGIAPHRHGQHAEWCYVLKGALALTQDESTTILTSGSAALVLPGIPHAYWNPTAAPTTIVLGYHPGANESEAIALAMGAAAGLERL